MKKLGDVCKILNGGTPKTGIPEYWDGDINWITPADLGKLKSPLVYNTTRKITKKGLEKSSAKLFSENSIILSTRAPIGHLAINKVQMSTNQGCRGIVPAKNIEVWFLYYFLKNNIDLLDSLGTGATFKELSTNALSGIAVPLPPLSEQQRIVSIIDKCFTAIDQAKSNAEQNLKNAKELFESYLNGVFENKGDDWEESTIGETCNLMTGGTPSTTKKEYYLKGNIKWLVSGDINQKEIYDCEGRITEMGLSNSNARILPINSVMIALNGQGKTRGTVAMLRTEATCNQSLVSIYPKDVNKILPELIYANLDGRYNEIRKLTGDGGNDRRGLNMPIIRSINFSYPKSIQKQKLIISKLDTLNKKTQKLEEQYKKKIQELEEMKKSILQKAFSGEL
jgi:type I restriction enzyme S subunit